MSPRDKKRQNSSEEHLTDTRRRFLARLWVVLGGVAFLELFYLGASFLRRSKATSAPVAEDVDRVDCGRVDQYVPGSVTTFVRGRFYLVRLEDGGFLALSRQCTHLGCTVPWVEEEKRFVCPCHASAFNISGDVISAPAPRALDIYAVFIENNTIRVDIRAAKRRSGFTNNQAVYAKLT